MGGRGGVATLGTGLPGEVTLLLSPPKAESYERRRHSEPYFHHVNGKRRQKMDTPVPIYNIPKRGVTGKHMFGDQQLKDS